MITAANSLASRFCERVGAIRSWDVATSRTYNVASKEEDFLIIIDSMCSKKNMHSLIQHEAPADCALIDLDLLFYVGTYTGDACLIDKAVRHAQLVHQTLIRPDFSTRHVVNLDPRDGKVKTHFTHQGYNDQSCWTRYAWTTRLFVAVLTDS